ncbi:P2Y purinoceptor 14-like [Pholidichthys leucotaenia]
MTNARGGSVTLSLNQSSIKNINDSTECGPVDTSSHTFFIVFYTVLFLVGLLLNGFTLRIYFFRTQQKTTNSITIYLKNLAVADFLLSLCLPIRIISYNNDSVIIRGVYCNFGAAAFYLNMYASILFMGYIAANRYLKIVRPLGNHSLQKVRAARIISIATWGFLLATTSTYILISVLTLSNDKVSVSKIVTCDELHSKQLRVFYKIVHTISAFIFIVILVSLVVFYCSISRRLSRAQRTQLASSGSEKLARSRRNMLVLVSVFCLCFVPYHLVRLPYAFREKLCYSRTQMFFYLKELTILLSTLNVCLDPLIYFIFCKAFRTQLNLRRVFSVTHAATHQPSVERRESDDVQAESEKISGGASLTSMMTQSRMLER